jgi:hypothetical protein
MDLPQQKCPKTEKRDCPLCGRWLGWIDLNDPGRSPTPQEWAAVCAQMQAHHDKTRGREFDGLRVEPYHHVADNSRLPHQSKAMELP